MAVDRIASSCGGATKPKGQLVRKGASGCFVCGVVGSLLAISTWVWGLRFNLTPSLPVGVYRTATAIPRRGMWVSVCPPRPIAVVARTRGYLHRGACPGGVMPLGKVIVGVPGDTVSVTWHGVIVNGHVITRSQPRAVDGHGHPLPQVFGTRVLSVHQYWIMSPFHVRSFDSRYFGSIPLGCRVTQLVPMWTTRTAEDEGPP